MDNIVRIRGLARKDAGGKALGLKFLMDCGLDVPEGFVIIGPPGPLTPDDLSAFVDENDERPRAVRSSAASEDGNEHSFAGQFDSFLNIRGRGAITEAVNRCIASSGNARVRNYSAHRASGADLRMSIVVQHMVEARAAGVVFTADPVTGRRDTIVIDAVPGLGESLVSGRSDPEHSVFMKSGSPLRSASPYPERLLPPETYSRIRAGALLAEQRRGVPMDLEWAVDGRGNLYWLQARPVTALDPVHFNELDVRPPRPDDILTRCNIGEMMPGAVTPLTWSVFGRALEEGMQDFVMSIGAQRKPLNEFHYFTLAYNFIFINISSLYAIPRRIIGVKKEALELSLLGQTIPGDPLRPDASVFRRVLNLLKYIKYIMLSPGRLKKLRKIEREFRLDTDSDSANLHAQLGRARDLLCRVYAHHYATSSQSGAFHSALITILSKNAPIPDPSHHRDVALLLSNIEGINGADALKALEELTLAISLRSDHRERFLNAKSGEELLHLLENDTGETGRLFREFLNEHGHRCVREAELRETDWSTNPAGLVSLLQTRITAELSQRDRPPSAAPAASSIPEVLAGLKLPARLSVGMLLPAAKKAVARRENSKSLCIKIQSRIKKGYLALGEKLASSGLLSDADQVFFLTHEELGRLIARPDPSCRTTAEKRRALMPELMNLEFPDISREFPEPLTDRAELPPNGLDLRGLPVSGGTVHGRARIVNGLEDARRLEPGDIMIASYTDVGWTPYFSIIAGLVTEIGSPLSHGAVVAREYGIPAVVNVKSARKILRDGETIILDGSKGVVTRREDS